MDQVSERGHPSGRPGGGREGGRAPTVNGSHTCPKPLTPSEAHAWGGGDKGPCPTVPGRTLCSLNPKNLHFCILETGERGGGGIPVIFSQSTVTMTRGPPSSHEGKNRLSTSNISVAFSLYMSSFAKHPTLGSPGWSELGCVHTPGW